MLWRRAGTGSSLGKVCSWVPSPSVRVSCRKLCSKMLASSDSALLPQSVGDKHRMSFPETVDEILDVSEDEGEGWELGHTIPKI